MLTASRAYKLISKQNSPVVSGEGWGGEREKKILLERHIMKCSSHYFVNSIRDVIQAQLTSLSAWLCTGLTAPLTPLLRGNLYLLMWQLCDLPTSGSPRSNSPSPASVEVSQLLFSHNSGSAKLSFTNGKKRSLWNQGFL